MEGVDEVYCTTCRAIIPRGESFCTECGAEQTNAADRVEPEFLPPGRKYCSNCGNDVEIGAPYCGECGAKQTGDDATDATLTEWMIGFVPGATLRNVAVGGVLYLLVFPVGIPLFVHSYLHVKNGHSKRLSIAVALVVGVFLLATIA